MHAPFILLRRKKAVKNALAAPIAAVARAIKMHLANAAADVLIKPIREISKQKISEFKIPRFYYFARFLMASNASLLITCSILHASSSAMFLSTPIFIRKLEIIVWRS